VIARKGYLFLNGDVLSKNVLPAEEREQPLNKLEGTAFWKEQQQVEHC
jgi:hypothetical protein